MKKPYLDFWNINIRLCTQTDEWLRGIRKISFEYEKCCCTLLSECEKWKSPIVQWKIFLGPIMINGHIPTGKIVEVNYRNLRS